MLKRFVFIWGQCIYEVYVRRFVNHHFIFCKCLKRIYLFSIKHCYVFYMVSFSVFYEKLFLLY